MKMEESSGDVFDDLGLDKLEVIRNTAKKLEKEKKENKLLKEQLAIAEKGIAFAIGMSITIENEKLEKHLEDLLAKITALEEK